MARHVWVRDPTSWMHGGTYLVIRRIRLLLDTWDRVDLAVQEAVIGRDQRTNERTDAPSSAHVRIAAPEGYHPDPALREAAKARSAEEVVLVERQAKAFESGVPSARVVRLPGAHHYVFLSNEADVLREMRAFVAGLR